MKYQNGSLRKKTRRSGEHVWEFRYRDADGVMRQKTLACAQYPNAASVKVALQSLIFKLNDPATMNKTTPFGMVVERFIVEEQLRDIAAQPAGAVTIPGLAYSTAKGYLSYLKNHIQPRWSETPIEHIRAMDVMSWLKELPVAPLTRGHIKAVMHMLFERAMLWDLLPAQRNPIDLIRIKGTGVRKKKKIVLTVEQFQALRGMLQEPYRTMVTLAICTGLRVSEITALRWDHIKDGALLVQAGSYHGRIGSVKTQASNDEIPLHEDILRDWMTIRGRLEGLVFPSPITGGPYYGGGIQQEILRPAGRRLGVGDNLGWHSLRHTYRSLLDGAPVGVQQKLMRHANVSTTMNVYGASAMRDKREANSKVVKMVVGRAG